MRLLGGRAGRCVGGTAEGRGRSSYKPRGKVFNRFPHDMQSDLPHGMAVEESSKTTSQNKEPESEATITPQPKIAYKALFSSSRLLFSQVIIYIRNLLSFCYMHC
jgi:hypothetical protein